MNEVLENIEKAEHYLREAVNRIKEDENTVADMEKEEEKLRDRIDELENEVYDLKRDVSVLENKNDELKEALGVYIDEKSDP